MAPKVSNSQSKEKHYVWSPSTTMKFLTICRDYQKKHGFEQPFSWPEIAEQLQDQTGKPSDWLCVKNKFGHMKTIWRTWTDLRLSETGLGFDHQTGRILADDSWWEKKIKVRLAF